MKLDTISLITDTGYLRDFDNSKFTNTRIVKPNGLVVVNDSLIRSSPGLERININSTFETVSFTVNSKILKENYFQGFNSNTLDQLLSEIKKEGVELDPDFLLDCKLKQVDVVDDIPISKSLLCYLNSLSHIIAPKFIKTVYDSGIVFNEKISTSSLYCTFYSKGSLPPADKRFFKQYAKAALGFESSIRMETKLRKTSTIGKYLPALSLPEIFQETSINSKVLDKIINNQTSYPSSINFQDLTGTEEKNLIYAKYLSSFYQGDRKKIALHIQRRLGKKTKASYQLKQMDQYLAILNNMKDTSIADNIKELKFGLEADAKKSTG